MQNDLIVGRKSIMSMLKITNWASVVKLIKRAGCPVGKLEGRWVARHSVLLGWIDTSTGTAGAKKCQSLSRLTNMDSIPADKHLKWRGKKMPEFLAVYALGKSIRGTCIEVGISRETYYSWRRVSELFDTACKDIEGIVEVITSERA